MLCLFIAIKAGMSTEISMDEINLTWLVIAVLKLHHQGSAVAPASPPPLPTPMGPLYKDLCAINPKTGSAITICIYCHLIVFIYLDCYILLFKFYISVSLWFNCHYWKVLNFVSLLKTMTIKIYSILSEREHRFWSFCP